MTQKDSEVSALTGQDVAVSVLDFIVRKVGAVRGHVHVDCAFLHLLQKPSTHQHVHTCLKHRRNGTLEHPPFYLFSLKLTEIII